jgi:hypothetical protein
MLSVFVIGGMGLTILMGGLSLLLRKPVGTTLPPRAPALAIMALGTVMVALALWGNKNPGKMSRLIRPTDAQCPKLLGPQELYELTQERANTFSGHKVEGGWCEYVFELKSGRKIKARVELDLTQRQDDWMKMCGNHPLAGGIKSEAWMRKVSDEEQTLCFLTTDLQGAIFLDKDADGLKWVRTMQTQLPKLVSE